MSGPAPMTNYGPPTAQAIAWAKHAGFSGLGLVTIVAIDRAESNMGWTAADFQNAWATSNQGTTFTHWKSDSTQAGASEPAFFAFVSYIANIAGVTLPADWKTKETNAQNDNVKQVPVIGGIVSGVDTVTGAVSSFAQLWTLLTSPATWIRIGVFVVSLTFLVIGFLILAHGEPKIGGAGGGGTPA